MLRRLGAAASLGIFLLHERRLLRRALRAFACNAFLPQARGPVWRSGRNLRQELPAEEAAATCADDPRAGRDGACPRGVAAEEHA